MRTLQEIAKIIESARVELRADNDAADQSAQKRIQFAADCNCSAYDEPHMMGTGRCHRESEEDRRRRESADKRSFDALIDDPRGFYRARARRNEP